MFAQQDKMVPHEGPYRPLTAAAVRPPLHLGENAVIYLVPYEEITPGIATYTTHELTMTREGHNRRAPRRSDSNGLDGTGPSRGHRCILKHVPSMSMFERRCYQSPAIVPIPPPELQTQIHDHGTADHVPKRRHPDRITGPCERHPLHRRGTRKVRAVLPCRCRKNQNTHQHTTEHLTKLARWREI